MVGIILWFAFALLVFFTTKQCYVKYANTSAVSACGYFDLLTYLGSLILIPIGILIGWLYGKMKNRKKQIPNI